MTLLHRIWAATVKELSSADWKVSKPESSRSPCSAYSFVEFDVPRA